MRLNSWTGPEGSPVSSLNCDRPLHPGLKAPELVMDAGCRDNRWTVSLCTSPPGCSPLILKCTDDESEKFSTHTIRILTVDIEVSTVRNYRRKSCRLDGARAVNQRCSVVSY